MKLQPLFFIAILLVLLTMMVLESDVIQSQSQRAVAAQPRR
jgi:hypothetical protein